MRENWIKHKATIILVLLAAAVLTGAFFWGGAYPKPADSMPSGISEPAASNIEKTSAPVAPAVALETENAPSENPSTSPDAASQAADKVAASGSAAGAKPAANTSSPGAVSGGTGAKAKDINPQTGKDASQTDPVPIGKPLPVEPQNAAITDEQATCTLSVSCETILNQMDLLEEDKWELIPKDGVIYAAKTVTFYEGESVFNVLQREMKQAGIQMEFTNTPLYHSAYIASIGNLYEFDAGELSGWVYEVNGWFPNYGCSRYQLQDGDVIHWLYTCDLGEDVGGNNATGS